MSENIFNLIDKCEFGQIQTYKNLSIIPIITSTNYEFDFLTLKTGLKENLVEVRELDEGASVPEVTVINRSEKFLIIFDGEHLIGAKQNRIVNKTIVINPFSELEIPVSCTEEGRWHDISDKFGQSDMNAPNSMRKATKKELDSQSEVWEQVDTVLCYMNTRSSTLSLNEVFDELEPKFEECKNELKQIPSQIGFIALINGKFAGIDVITDKEVFRDLYQKIINSYLTEAVINSDQDKVLEDIDFKKNYLLAEVENAKTKNGEQIGVEKREVIKGKMSIGEFVSFQDKPIHFALFAENGE